MAEIITLKDVYNEIKRLESNMVTKEELNRIIETFEIISNPKTMEQIRNSEADIKTEKVTKLNSVKDII